MGLLLLGACALMGWPRSAEWEKRRAERGAMASVTGSARSIGAEPSALAAVAEPATLILLGSGLVGVSHAVRQRLAASRS